MSGTASASDSVVWKFTIQRIEVLVRFRFSKLRTKVGGHIAERRDAQFLREQLEFGMTVHRSGHGL
jgi:hypothetical protein